MQNDIQTMEKCVHLERAKTNYLSSIGMTLFKYFPEPPIFPPTTQSSHPHTKHTLVQDRTD
jgi:hypothetical protein